MSVKCPIHDFEMRLIPAGISKKTGKPYKAFYVCSVEGCQEKGPAPEIEEKQPVVAPLASTAATFIEEPMKKKDWNRKDFTEGLRALTFEHRKEDMHPIQVWESTEVKNWMRALYGDYEGYEDWEEELEARISKLKNKEQKMKEDVDSLLGEEDVA